MSTQRTPIYFRVLVFRQGDQWLAQCLEHDLVAQAPSGDEAFASFIRLLKARLLRDSANGRVPLENLPPAPQRFVDIWNQLTTNKTVPATPISFPDDDRDHVTEAYILSQIANSGDSAIFHQ